MKARRSDLPEELRSCHCREWSIHRLRFTVQWFTRAVFSGGDVRAGTHGGLGGVDGPEPRRPAGPDQVQTIGTLATIHRCSYAGGTILLLISGCSASESTSSSRTSPLPQSARDPHSEDEMPSRCIEMEALVAALVDLSPLSPSWCRASPRAGQQRPDVEIRCSLDSSHLRSH